jgi:hypothetical protein
VHWCKSGLCIGVRVVCAFTDLHFSLSKLVHPTSRCWHAAEWCWESSGLQGARAGCSNDVGRGTDDQERGGCHAGEGTTEGPL